MQEKYSHPGAGSLVGEPVLRIEDDSLLRGTAHFLDDLKLPGESHVAFVRSEKAHAEKNTVTNKITSQGTEKTN